MFQILYHYKFGTNPRTIEDHVDILSKYGEVWWGVFGKGISEKKTKEIKSQVFNGFETKVVLTASFQNLHKYHVARIKDIITKKNPWFPFEESELIPFYYRGSEILTWLKLDDIKEVDKSFLKQYTLQSNPQRDLEESLKGQSSIMYIIEKS
jgi:hypothetical protein